MPRAGKGSAPPTSTAILAIVAIVSFAQAASASLQTDLGVTTPRFFVVPPFDRSRFTPVLSGAAAFDERMLQSTILPAPDANTNASIALLVSNENKQPDQPLIVSFTPNNDTTAEAEIGVARDYETDCQKPASQMTCRGNWFVPPSYVLNPTVSNPSGCPLVNGDIGGSAAVGDYLQYSICNQQLIQTVNCNVSPQLEDAYDLSLSGLYQDYSCFRLRGVNNTCGAGGLLRVYWVMGKDGNPPLLYQPAFLKIPFYGTDINQIFCFKIAALPSPTPTPTATSTSSRSYSATVSISFSPTSTASISFSPTSTRTSTVSISFSPTISISRSESVSISFSPSNTGSAPSTPTNTPTYSPTRTSTVSISLSATSTPSGVSATQTASITGSRSYSSTYTPSATVSRSFTASFTPSPTNLTSLIGAYASLQAHASELAAAREREQQARLNISSILDTERGANSDATQDASAQQEALQQKVGILAGVISLLALLALLCCWWFFLLPCWRRRKREKEKKQQLVLDANGNPLGLSSDEPLPGKLELLASQLEFSHTNALHSPNGGRNGGMRKSHVAHFNPLAVDADASFSLQAKRVSGVHVQTPRNAASLRVEKARSTELQAYNFGRLGSSRSVYDAGEAEAEPVADSDDPFASLSLPLDATTAAYMGIDGETGKVGNFAAYWAYKVYITDGQDYTTAYNYYAKWIEENGAPTEPYYVGSVFSGAAQEAEADNDEQGANDDDSEAGPFAISARARPSGTSARPRSIRPARKKELSIPTGTAAPPKKLEMGVGDIRRSVVLKETVNLRRVDTIKGDQHFKGVDGEKTFTGVKERKRVELPSAKKAAMVGLSTPASAFDIYSPGLGAKRASTVAPARASIITPKRSSASIALALGSPGARTSVGSKRPSATGSPDKY